MAQQEIKIRMSNPGDVFEFELFKNSLYSLADEMALTILRTAYSSVLKGSMDYSTAICDAQGRMVAQGLTLPQHLGSIPTALASVLGHYDNEMQDGDVYVLNDPFDGGMHLPDIFLFKPVFHDGERICFAATICHHTDVGGRVAGSNASDSTECYQEGLRIPPLKLFEGGKRNESLWALIEKNVRVPILVQGDLRAQLSACHIGETGLLELVGHYGAAQCKAYLEEIIDYTERLTRAAVRELPDGTYEFEDWLDDDGIDYGQPIRLKVTFHKRGDAVHADWTGTSPQVKGALNCTLSFTKAAVYTAVKCILPDDIPSNEGFFRVVQVTAPPGTIANAVHPAATAARGLTGFRQLDCCFGALAKMVPDRVCAASDGGNVGVSLGGYGADRTPFIYVDFFAGAWGGRPWADGLQGNANLCANLSSTSVEVTEVEQPLQILRYEFVPDAMGAGKYRGGAPFRRDYRMREREGTLQVRNDRCNFHPYGLFGGKPGRNARNIYNPDRNDEELLPGKFTRTFREGDVFRYEMAGAGGWGDPLDRDPARVLHDVRNEYVSPEAARGEYGVVIDIRNWTVDIPATERLRTDLRQARSRHDTRFVDWGELPDGIVPAGG
jgi:N-methylhydantoinase B